MIGPNGAGKSTILKVIARVCRPTEGRVVVRGRVAPLLELGLGFHGSSRGARTSSCRGRSSAGRERRWRREWKRSRGSPRSRASSTRRSGRIPPGWSARLAFATATDVDPDVLLVDETLSVGDERFVAKCHERMAGFRERGKTFFLVTHSLPEVEKTCHRAIWLLDGEVVADGEPKDVCERYREWARNGGSAPRPVVEASPDA